MGGFSEIDYPDKSFWCPEANQAFVDALKKHLRPDILVEISAKDVNDPEFYEQGRRAASGILEGQIKGE